MIRHPLSKDFASSRRAKGGERKSNAHSPDLLLRAPEGPLRLPRRRLVRGERPCGIFGVAEAVECERVFVVTRVAHELLCSQSHDLTGSHDVATGECEIFKGFAAVVD